MQSPPYLKDFVESQTSHEITLFTLTGYKQYEGFCTHSNPTFDELKQFSVQVQESALATAVQFGLFRDAERKAHNISLATQKSGEQSVHLVELEVLEYVKQF